MNDTLKLIILTFALIGCIVSAFYFMYVLSNAVYGSDGTQTIIGTLKAVQVDKNEITIILTNQTFTYHTLNYEQQQVPLVIGVTYQFDLSTHFGIGEQWFTLKSVTQLGA